MEFKYKKIFILYVLVFVFIFMQREYVYAQEDSEDLLEEISDNNCWGQEISGYEVHEMPVAVYSNSDITYVEDVISAADLLREQMIQRNGKISIYYHGEYADGMSKDIFETALAYDSDLPGYAGDYLRYHYNRVVRRTYRGSNQDGEYLRFEYELYYLSSYEQELEVELKVQEILDTLNVYASDRETKIRSVYDYITENVRYDNMIYETFNVHSAYGAAVQKKAVCQGYSLLLYRLLQELGIENRMIPGNAGDIGHIWNIVEMDGLWYNMDATWDWGKVNGFDWFLKGTETFDESHIRREAFTTEDFNQTYPMSQKDYDYEEIEESDVEETQVPETDEPEVERPDRDPETLFLECCYEMILNRQPDKTGIEYWKEKILVDQWGTMEILLGFFRSKEYSAKQDALLCTMNILTRILKDEVCIENMPSSLEKDETLFIYELYIEYLERQPDIIGFMDWYNKKINDELTEKEIREGFIFSTEYQLK